MSNSGESVNLDMRGIGHFPSICIFPSVQQLMYHHQVRDAEASMINNDSKPANILLKSLSVQSFEKIAGRLKHFHQPLKALITEKHQPFKYAYFPDDGMIATVLITTDGVPIEVGTVGKEGFVGIPILLGFDISDRRIFSQIPGNGWRMETKDFKAALEEVIELRLLCQRFTLTMMNQISQTAACNRLHSIEMRCARWLLSIHDRDTEKTVEMTQEHISMMLGVRRSGVNIAMKTLEHSGLIEHGRGSIKILNRKEMEAVACCCYGDVKKYFHQTMGFSL